jgi:hypothetical protein
MKEVSYSLLLVLALGGCTSIPSDWLFSNNSLLRYLCGKKVAEVEAVLGEQLTPTIHHWATYELSRGPQRIYLHFQRDSLTSFEAIFDIPGREAAASLGRYACGAATAAAKKCESC